MRLRIIVSVAAVWVLGAIIASSFWVKTSRTQESKVKDFQIPVTVKQLEPENGTIPVELKCGYAELSAQNSLQRLPCRIVNNTNKYITASSIIVSIIFESNGQSRSDSTVLTIETLLDPNLRDERKKAFIPPKGDSRVEPLPVSYDGDIKEIILQVDYVEFEDNTNLGPNKSGSEVISKIREGVAKYKNWLLKNYERSGQSEIELTKLLQKNQSIPEELNLKASYWEGAFQYRNLLRRIYEAEGATAVSKYLSKQQLTKERK